MPSITQITPALFDSGRSVTLTGTGFGASQGTVSIGGVSQAVTAWSDTSITFTAVRGSQSLGACRVDVVGAGGGASTAWYSTDFESFTDEQDITTTVFSSGTRVYADTADAYAGAKSGRIDFVAGGSAGGGTRILTPTLSTGDELWFRFRAKFQPGWLFNAGAGWKFVRVHVENAANAHLGYLDWYNASDRYPGYAFYYRNEPRGGTNTSFGTFSTQNFDPGNWHTYEVYYKLHSDAAQGRVRAWRDGANILDAADNTLQAATDKVNEVRICTFFNPDTGSGQSFNIVDSSYLSNTASLSGAPQNQSMWIDDFSIYTSASPPTNVDSGGRVFVGV